MTALVPSECRISVLFRLLPLDPLSGATTARRSGQVETKEPEQTGWSGSGVKVHLEPPTVRVEMSEGLGTSGTAHAWAPDENDFSVTMMRLNRWPALHAITDTEGVTSGVERDGPDRRAVPQASDGMRHSLSGSSCLWWTSSMSVRLAPRSDQMRWRSVPSVSKSSRPTSGTT